MFGKRGHLANPAASSMKIYKGMILHGDYTTLRDFEIANCGNLYSPTRLRMGRILVNSLRDSLV